MKVALKSRTVHRSKQIGGAAPAPGQPEAQPEPEPWSRSRRSSQSQSQSQSRGAGAGEPHPHPEAAPHPEPEPLAAHSAAMAAGQREMMARRAARLLWPLAALAARQPPTCVGQGGGPSVFVDDALKAFSGESQMAASMARARRSAELSSSVGELELLGPNGDELHDEVITNPSNLIFGADGSLFVASFTLDHVVRFQFPAVARRLRYTIFASDLDGPSALAVDEASGGGLFVASFGGDEVLRFDPDGMLIQRYGNEEEVDCPEGLAVLDGLLYVSSWHRGWVVRYNISTGAFLGQFVSPPAKPDTHPLAPPPPPSATAFPEELAFTPSGDLLVSHFYSNTLSLYRGKDGEAMGPLLRGKVLRGPVGMVVGPDGLVYVGSYRRNVVLRLAADTGAVLDVVAARGELNGLAGIAFAPDGALYVSSYEDSRVLRFNVSEVPTKPWEAGRRRAVGGAGGQLDGEGESEAEGEERQRQIERMLGKLKQAAKEEVKSAKKKKEKKKNKTAKDGAAHAGGPTGGEFEFAGERENGTQGGNYSTEWLVVGDGSEYYGEGDENASVVGIAGVAPAQ